VTSLTAGPDADEFVELRFKPGCWEQSGIPEVGCRIRQSALERLLEQQGSYDVEDLILGLMDWLDVTDEPEPALATLRQLLDRHYPADGRTSARCRFAVEDGGDRLFHAGGIDPARPSVAWQRGDWIIAAGQRSIEPGRMVVGAPGPISLKTALRIFSLAMLDFMGEPFDSFVGAQASCASTAAVYLWEAGEVTPVRWDDGFDTYARASLDRFTREGGWLVPNQLAMQVAIAAGYQK
jgi:hypothetical protein